jgi:glutamine amidotransferase
MTTVAVIDYGMGNLHSVAKALEHAQPGVEVRVTPDHERILDADRVLLPGVGAIRDCMAEIRRLQLDTLVHEVIARGTPLLAICVGLQALFSRSDENNGVDCLDVFAGEVKYFGDDLVDPANGLPLKIPHMGWNQVRQTRDHPLWQGIADGARFYFVHSYHVVPADEQIIVGTSDYGKMFTAAVARDNIFAAQFHPEKSSHDGLKLYENFLNWDGRA